MSKLWVIGSVGSTTEMQIINVKINLSVLRQLNIECTNFILKYEMNLNFEGNSIIINKEAKEEDKEKQRQDVFWWIMLKNV